MSIPLENRSVETKILVEKLLKSFSFSRLCQSGLPLFLLHVSMDSDGLVADLLEDLMQVHGSLYGLAEDDGLVVL